MTARFTLSAFGDETADNVDEQLAVLNDLDIFGRIKLGLRPGRPNHWNLRRGSAIPVDRANFGDRLIRIFAVRANMNYSVLLSFSALLVIGSACVRDDPPVEVTIMAAQVGGILSEVDGCLRSTGPSGTGGDAIVWQKDVLSFVRRGETIDIYAGAVSVEEAPIASWRLGDPFIGMGGSIRRPEIVDFHAGAGFSQRCEGPYILLGRIQ